MIRNHNSTVKGTRPPVTDQQVMESLKTKVGSMLKNTRVKQITRDKNRHLKYRCWGCYEKDLNDRPGFEYGIRCGADVKTPHIIDIRCLFDLAEKEMDRRLGLIKTIPCPKIDCHHEIPIDFAFHETMAIRRHLLTFDDIKLINENKWAHKCSECDVLYWIHQYHSCYSPSGEPNPHRSEKHNCGGRDGWKTQPQLAEGPQNWLKDYKINSMIDNNNGNNNQNMRPTRDEPTTVNSANSTNSRNVGSTHGTPTIANSGVNRNVDHNMRSTHKSSTVLNTTNRLIGNQNQSLRREVFNAMNVSNSSNMRSVSSASTSRPSTVTPQRRGDDKHRHSKKRPLDLEVYDDMSETRRQHHKTQELRKRKEYTSPVTSVPDTEYYESSDDDFGVPPPSSDRKNKRKIS